MMYKTITVAILCLQVVISLGQQLVPAEGSSLNYRIIGFKWGNRTGVRCRLEIAQGDIVREDAFAAQVSIRADATAEKVITEVPSFGQAYTWRVVEIRDGREVYGKLHHFSTMSSWFVDERSNRLRVIHPAADKKGKYVFTDGAKALYDMDGRPVWFLPEIEGIPASDFIEFGDLKLTDRGTITFMTSRKAGQIYEVNYAGRILWKGPNTGKVSGDTVEHYNHEFRKLKNGHYMSLGQEFRSLKLPGKVDSVVLNSAEARGKVWWDSKTKAFYQKAEFSTLIEYDSTGKQLWAWRSADYFLHSDVYDHVNSHGVYDVDDAHENAFFFDEERRNIYVSYKTISRILKLSYPQGKVIAAYGARFSAANPGYVNGNYLHQHTCGLTHDGLLYVYNNNNSRPGVLPTLVLMKEPVNAKDTLQKVWEYVCATDGMDTTIKDSIEFAGLGSVAELPGGTLLGCMTTDEYSRVMIVNRNKETLWSALPERWKSDEQKWNAILEYRCSMINSEQELERLIWHK